MKSAGCKTIRTRRPGECIYINIYKQCTKGVYFHLILLGIPSSMIMSVKHLGWGQRFT